MGRTSSVKSYLYVDDSKLLQAIKSEEDVVKFQTEMEVFYNWAESNNMSFNGDKFVVLRYGRNNDIRSNTSYFTENWEDIITSKN